MNAAGKSPDRISHQRHSRARDKVAFGKRAAAAAEPGAERRQSCSDRRADTKQLREEIMSLRERVSRMQEEAERINAAHNADLADLRQANERLVIATVRADTMKEAADRANRTKEQLEQFLAMLAHELRNPLAPIMNALAVLDRIKGTQPELPWARDVINRQVKHMARLLNDLLDVSRITRGKIELQKRPTQVAEILIESVEASRPLSNARKQRLSVEMPAEPLMVYGDPTRLAQIFSNLLNNAVKYTSEGGAISVSALAQDDTVVIRIKDSGMGITAEQLPHVFELFVQEDHSLAHTEGGLGIGLTIVRSLVEMHSSSVVAQSAGRGQGSEFVVTLPRMRNSELQAGSRKDNPSPLVERHYHIVLIEDNVDSNDSLRLVLTSAGHRVSSAFDGATGLSLVLESAPDIVLCDIGLPRMDGYELAARVRARKHREQPVMIALTGYGQSEDRARALAQGFDHYLVKPVDPSALLNLISSVGAASA